jgi:hypothetical protein
MCKLQHQSGIRACAGTFLIDINGDRMSLMGSNCGMLSIEQFLSCIYVKDFSATKELLNRLIYLDNLMQIFISG